MKNLSLIQNSLLYYIYCRKSSDERSEKQTLSNPAQERELKEVAKRGNLNCLNFQNPYKEEETAFKPGRELFNEMLDRIEQGSANAILVWELSRLSRNPLDTGRLRWLMEEGKIKEIRTKDKIYTELDSFLIDIELAMANKESKDTSRRTKRNLLEKAKINKEFPGWAPFGYLNIDKKTQVVAGQTSPYKKQVQKILEKRWKKEKRLPKRIEVDPIKGPLVKRMFEYFATGLYSLEMTVSLTTKWGLFNRGGDPLNRSTISQALSNPFYYGVFKFKGELYEGNHEPIISKVLFDKVQKVLKKKSKPFSQHHFFLFNGLLKCGECGCSVTGDLKKNKYRLYRCTLKKKGVNCNQRHYINEKEIERQFAEKVKEITINDVVRDLLMESIKRKNDEKTKIHINGLDYWQRVQRECEEGLRRINNALADGIYAYEEYLEQKQRILQRKIDAKEKIGVHEKGSKAWHDYAERLIITTNHAYKVFTEGKPEDKTALLRAVGTNFKLKDGLITFDIREPFNFIRLINKSKSSSRKVVLRGLDSNQDT